MPTLTLFKKYLFILRNPHERNDEQTQIPTILH